MTKKIAKMLLVLSIAALVLSAVYSVIFIFLTSLSRSEYISFMEIKLSSFDTHITFWQIGLVIAIVFAVLSIITIVIIQKRRFLGSDAPIFSIRENNGEADVQDSTKQDENINENADIDTATQNGDIEFTDLDSLQPTEHIGSPLLQETENLKNPDTLDFSKTAKVVDIDTLFNGFNEFLKENDANANLENVRKVLSAVVSDEKTSASYDANSFSSKDKKADAADDLKEKLFLYIRQNCIYNLSKTCDECEKSFFMDEESWKKLDKIEDWFRAITVTNGGLPYEIGNKQWRAIEKYTSVYLACGGSCPQALDNVIADRLLPEIITGIKKTDGLEPFLKKVLGDECSASLNATTRFTLDL